jgi:hypothetical protein
MERLKEILLEAAIKEAGLEEECLGEPRTPEEVEREFNVWVSEPEAEIFFGCIKKWYDEKLEAQKPNIQKV